MSANQMDAGVPAVGQASTPDSETSVTVEHLTVRFDEFVAVDDVSLLMLKGQVHFLIGPNGAGKTTLVDALTGLVPATGTAMYNGLDLIATKTNKIIRAGIGRTFQTATVFDELSVLQNLDIAGGVHRSAWRLPLVRRGVPEYVERALETIGLTAHRDKLAGTLAHGQKQWLEIGMLLVQDAQVMFLDEPVAGMNADERDETGQLLRRIGDERTIIVIEHDMDFVRNYAEWVTVMHSGKLLTAGTVEQVHADKRVQEVYLGTVADAAAEAAADEEGGDL
ncbi:ABC transporter ATP-binding protein [Microbacterium sp.]|uniref:ABC transporter ATP-binding protein n=1 Tax=Microbacterium sp. TaxID=51671 RepID=UPI003C75C3AA